MLDSAKGSIYHAPGSNYSAHIGSGFVSNKTKVKYARLRVVDRTEKLERIVFELDITQSLLAGEDGDLSGSTFSGLTSWHYSQSKETDTENPANNLPLMSLDCDGEANGLDDNEKPDLDGYWKFIDPGPEFRRNYSVEVVLRFTEMVTDTQPGGPDRFAVSREVRDSAVLQVRARHVAVIPPPEAGDPPKNGYWEWWRERMHLGTAYETVETSDKDLLSFRTLGGEQENWDSVSFPEALSFITPRGNLLYVGHAGMKENPNEGIHTVDPEAEPPDGDDGTDLYGFQAEPDENGVQQLYAGFIGNGIESGTDLSADPDRGLPPLTYQPRDLEDIPRAHKITVSLVGCWTAHRSAWDDSGPSVADTLWEVLNNRGCSASVGGSWGPSSQDFRTAIFYRPTGDDEGSDADLDADTNPSTWFDDASGDGPERDDTHKPNWIVRPARKAGKE